MADSSLYVQSQGAGRELVLVHGWGLNGDVWEEIAQALIPRYRVTVVDLPGYGRSSLVNGRYSLDGIAEALAAAVPRSATWVGWSLGGLVCQQLAHQHAHLVERLMLVGSSPRFVAAADWPCGIDRQLLTQFGGNLAADFRGTLLRFLALEARGGDRAREELRTLRARMFRHGDPELAAVQGGLDLLRDSDLCSRMGLITCPIQMILGERDQLVPATSLAQTQSLNPAIAGTIIPGASHAPFVSHRETFIDHLVEFMAR